MAEDTVNKAMLVGGLPEKECVTKHMPIHGYVKNTHFETPGYFYGADRAYIMDIIHKDSSLGERLHPDYEISKAQVLWAVRNEMARIVEDFLARRVRALMLDARASMKMAPEVASLMAQELGYGQDWVESQIEHYTELAKGYILE
jgi:glycerol-3-phosphate dehydrogenase